MGKDHIGESFGEKWHLFLQSGNKDVPLQVENIGVTTPNQNFGLSRNNSDLFIIEYIVSGKEHLKVENKDFLLSEGDTCIIEPNTTHSYHSDPIDPVEKKWINFTSPLFHKIYKELGLSGKCLFKDFNSNTYFEELLILAERSRYSEDICFDAIEILLKLIFELKKSIFEEQKILPSNTAKKVKNYLDSCVFKTLSLDELSKSIMYSKKQLTREFKKCYNNTPYKYLLELKISTAKRLLEITDMPIKEIADRLRFENQHYFSKAFKSKVGVSPTEYKNNNRINNN